MKEPNRIVGILEVDGIKIPFELMKDTFELRLYNQEKQDAFEWLKNHCNHLKKHEWVKEITIEGQTSEGLLIFMGTIDNPDNYNGFLTYHVNWYYITQKDSRPINEIRFYGRDIECFYNPNRAFEQKIFYKEDDNRAIESMSVQTKNNNEFYCGQFESKYGKIDVSCYAYAILHPDSKSPFNSESRIKLRTSNTIGIDELIVLSNNVRKLMKYVCYRSNISFSNIMVFSTTSDGVTHEIGKLVFKDSKDNENIDKAEKRIIKAEYLHEHVSELLSSIENNEMPYGHYCESIADRSNYPVSRIIMILAAFEGEYKRIYGTDAKRSQAYKDIKLDVVNLLEDFANKHRGKKRKYISSIAKGIKNHDLSYGDNLFYALEDCKEIMTPFVIKKYDGKYEEIIEEVCSNINDLRNSLAHCNLDYEFEARHLADIKIVEEMIYAIRLKKIGIETRVIQRAINELFNENIPI